MNAPWQNTPNGWVWYRYVIRRNDDAIPQQRWTIRAGGCTIAHRAYLESAFFAAENHARGDLNTRINRVNNTITGLERLLKELGGS